METIRPDLYLPRPALIDKVITENSQIKTFELAFVDPGYNEAFQYQPGQFMMVSVPHQGEAPISFSSSPTRPGSIHLSVRKAGRLTGALHDLAVGDIIGLRGPYGRPFPMEALKNRNLLFVAGGIGLAPLRSVINCCLDNRDEYGDLTVLYGSRTPSDIAFQDDIGCWSMAPGVTCHLTVDQGEDGWKGNVGLVTSLFDSCSLAGEGCTALICGPPLMIRAVLGELSKRGYDDEQIITTMERHMKCGVGICRHCNLDDKLVCVDGPVFSLAELRRMDVMELVP